MILPPLPHIPLFRSQYIVVHWRSSGCLLSPIISFVHLSSVFSSFCIFVSLSFRLCVFLSSLIGHLSSYQFILFHQNSPGSILDPFHYLFLVLSFCLTVFPSCHCFLLSQFVLIHFQFISTHLNSFEVVLVPPEACLAHSEAFVWMDG